MTKSERFRTTVEAARGGGALVRIPAEAAEALGGVQRVRVTGRLNGQPFESNTMPARGVLYLGLHKATREAAGVQIGDEVEVTLSRDDRPRAVDVPPELAAALARNRTLRAAFDGLSFTRRRELAASVASARKAETRSARLARVLDVLRGRT
jgi:hypothetical protein